MADIDPKLLVLFAIAFDERGGVSIEYTAPGKDAKDNGILASHSLMVPKGGEYDEEIDAMHEAALYLLRDVLDDFPRMPGIEVVEPEPDEEDE